MAAALIPAAIVGIILLLLGGRLLNASSTFFPSKEVQEKRDAKGAVGNSLDYLLGEGTTDNIRDKGLAGAAVDTVAGEGAYEAHGQQLKAAAAGTVGFIDDAYTGFQVGLHNALTDPFNLRGIPDLTLHHVKELERRGYNVQELNAQQIHDLVLGGALASPTAAARKEEAAPPPKLSSGGVDPGASYNIGTARGLVLEGL